MRRIDRVRRRRAAVSRQDQSRRARRERRHGCADHEIAKRIRHLANLDPEKGEFADDIVYASADGASEFAHPLCDNTWRNGKKLGDESKAKGY